jgi:hypothetical protein
MPLDDTEVILPPITYTPAPPRERRPVPWPALAAIVIGAPALAVYLAICVKIILAVWG